MPARDSPPVIVETKPPRAAVARVAAVCPDTKMKTSPVRLRTMTDNLVASARTDVGDAEVESSVAVVSGPDDVSCRLSTCYFAEALAVIEADFVEIRRSAEPRPIWVCGADEPENGIVIYPVRW